MRWATPGPAPQLQASTIYTQAQLSDPEFTKKHGLGGSVMDYNANNIALGRASRASTS